MKMTLRGVEKVAGRVHRGNKEPRRREKERTSVREKGSVVYRWRRREKINRKEAGMSLRDWLRDATLWRNMCVNGCQGEWLAGLFFAPSTSTFFVGGACGNQQREWRSPYKSTIAPFRIFARATFIYRADRKSWSEAWLKGWWFFMKVNQTRDQPGNNGRRCWNLWIARETKLLWEICVYNMAYNFWKIVLFRAL